MVSNLWRHSAEVTGGNMKKQAEIPAAAAQDAGKRLTNDFLIGAGAGVGGAGLLYLIKRLKRKMPQQPSVNDVAMSPALPQVKLAYGGMAAIRPGSTPMPIAPPSTTNVGGLALDASSALLPLGGAGIGALIGAVRSKPGRRLRGALRGGLTGGAIGGAGALLSSPTVQGAIGKSLQNIEIPGVGSLLGFGGGDRNDATNQLTNNQKSVLNIAEILAAGGGAYLGNSAVNALTEKNDEEKRLDEVASARDEYFKQLLGQDTKTAVDAALDQAYEHYEKHALTEWIPYVGETLTTAKGLAGVGAAGLAAKYMYDKTKAKSDAKLIGAARAARQRMQMAESPWVNPVELAQIKELAQQRASANQRGG